jgi:hypothetical protein
MGNTMNNDIYNLVDDIYKVVSSKEVPEGIDLEAEVERFGEGCKRLMRNLFTEERDGRTLRMSNIGRPDRFLWNAVNNPGTQEELTPNTYVKFMYGHLIEEMLLFLTRLSGHEVTDEQKKCEVAGIKGSMDCKIDGVVTDVKSVSSFGFKKFKDGTLAFDDPFGYVAQIKGYAHSEGETKFGWLAMDKQNGHIAYLMYDSEDKEHFCYDKVSYDIEEHIERVKKLVEQPEPPSVCYQPIADGKSGNQKLAVGCSYCSYKTICWPTLRAFAYSSGPRFLVEVHNEPKVTEIPLKELS